ncbi:hypothetical protein LUZ63_004315 [Rhynchospora breviuscula]|uniref:protein-serine/threonine phosphatase n=1 Tax=Rhynchospora breviuscula TaxID=2022672 RepID=A0A9Q0D287_9POAL|nr:hypothetical protein LUZ63_004315 [Rhynchospora breviuscula]
MTPHNHKREDGCNHEDDLSSSKTKRMKSDKIAEEKNDGQSSDSDSSATTGVGVTCKTHDPVSNTKVTRIMDAAAAEDKGCRHSMEDAWVILLPDSSSGHSTTNLRCAHFAIYDGHGGRMAAEFAQKNLHANVLAAGFPRELMDIKAAKKAIFQGFQRTDESLLKESEKGNWQDGATAVCVWVLGQTAIVANIGDAKAVLARASTINEGETTLKSIVLTREHKAIFPQERSRIQKAGGTVSPNGRLQGRLEVSRAFGDRLFKKVGVISTPDIHSFELTERDQFVLLGCDGLWRVFGPSDAVEFVQKQLKETSSATTAVRCLVREAIRERRCKDNCTAIVIVLKH